MSSKWVRNLVVMSLVLLIAPVVFAQQEEQKRLEQAGTVMQEIVNAPDNIPQSLLNRAKCVVVLPQVMKAAFGVGGSVGHGAMVCRSGPNFTGSWGAPAMYSLEGASFGVQIGGQATDVVLLIMNDTAVNSILRSKVKLGADASIAAGPKGREASTATDAHMRAEILSYSRSRGVFAGISLSGATLHPDNGGNKALYGRELTATEIVRGPSSPQAPTAAHLLINELMKASPHGVSKA
jgi:lipid-binding SYLF domain-containing protein